MKKNNAMHKKSTPSHPQPKTKPSAGKPLATKSAPAKAASKAASKATSKAVEKLKKFVTSMSAKSSKKPQVKIAPKPQAKVNHPPKKAAAPEKSAPKMDKNLKKPSAPVVSAKPNSQKLAPQKPGAKQAPSPAQAAASPKTVTPAPAAKLAAKVDPKLLKKPAPLTAKAKGEAKGKAKLTGAELAAHLERMCRENACENLATTKGYCRLDYIKNWKKIKRKEMILKEGKLNQYIEELVSKYPEKYIDVIRQDLTTEVNFSKVIHDLELDESIDDLDYDGDSIDSLIGSVRKESEGFDDGDF